MANNKDFGTLVLGDMSGDNLTLKKLPAWAQAVSRDPANPNADIVAAQCVFGRNPDSDVQFPSNKAISGHHCRVWRNGDGQVFLEDLSTNGTFVGGEKIGKNKSVPISSGTEFTLIPRGPGRPKVSYTLYITSEESGKDERAPEGHVTCCFTDVQGSTKLWESKAEAMDVGLRMHDRIMRRLLSRFRGYEVKTEGDAFFVVFGNPLDALRWCIAVQRALLLVDWHDDLLSQDNAARKVDESSTANPKPVIFSGIRVRMGLHCGEANGRVNPVTHRMDYFGPVVNRTARISDAAHGGQIVCTQEVVDALAKGAKEGKLSDDSKKAVTAVGAGAAAAASPSAATAADVKATPTKASAAAPPATPKDGKTTELTSSLKMLTMPRLDFEVDLKDLSLKDLGDQNYKGLAGAVKVWQVLPADLAARTFPPLRAGKKDDPAPTK